MINVSEVNNNAQKGLGINLEKEKYYYHCVKGFNLDQLTSILSFGILSKQEGYKYGINIQSCGLGLNGSQFVSVSNRIDAGSYSGTHLGVIINPINLDIIQKFGPEHLPFERQIYGKVPKENIVGITIPPNYVKKNFTDSQLFYVPCVESLKEGMDSLEKFYLKTLSISLLANDKLKSAYNKALAFNDEKKKIRENLPFLEAFKKVDELEFKTQADFNCALMERITEVYRIVIKKDSFTLVDIIQYHTKMPIYFTTGELVTSLTIEKE